VFISAFTVTVFIKSVVHLN